MKRSGAMTSLSDTRQGRKGPHTNLMFTTSRKLRLSENRRLSVPNFSGASTTRPLTGLSSSGAECMASRMLASAGGAVGRALVGGHSRSLGGAISFGKSASRAAWTTLARSSRQAMAAAPLAPAARGSWLGACGTSASTPSPASCISSLMFRPADAVLGRRGMSDAAPQRAAAKPAPSVFVVVKIQGKQYKVCEGDAVTIDNLTGRTVGAYPIPSCTAAAPTGVS